MRRRAIVFASVVLGLAMLLTLNPLEIGTTYAAERKAESTPEGLLAPVGLKATNHGFRVNEGGGGALNTGWVTGSLGNTWAEGEWCPTSW